MALFDDLSGVDNQVSMQVLLDDSDVTGQLTTNGITVVDEEEDVFQCGKCKRQFTSFTDFFLHKKTNCVGAIETVAREEEAIDLIYSEIVPEEYNEPPITLTESEFLSLSPCLEKEILGSGSYQHQLDLTNTSQELESCETYLSNTDQGVGTFQLSDTLNPDEVDLICKTSDAAKEDSSKFNKNPNAITVSVIDGVPDQLENDITIDSYAFKDADTSSGKIKCLYCGKMFTKNFDLTQHIRSHTGERPFQCIVCGRAFAQKSNVKKHMVSHKIWPKMEKLDDIHIPLSKEIWPKIGKLNGVPTLLSKENVKVLETRNEFDQLEDSYVCQYCPEVFKNYNELKIHCKIHTQQKVYRCIQKNCNEFFTDLDVFLGHTMSHEKDAQYHCHVCNKRFTSLDELGTHQYAHSLPTSKYGSRRLTCKKCKCKFTNLESLERHMVLDSHTYPCPTCNKVFLCARGLRRHKKIHSSTLSYKCQHCNKGFRTEQYLNNHVVIHSSEKPFACEHCPAAFNRRDRLTRHYLIHENLRKYKCPFSKHLGCTKSFNRKDKLKAHLLTHSTIRFTCNCSQVFNKHEDFKRHEKNCNKAGKAASKHKTAKSATTLQSGSKATSTMVGLDKDNMSTIEIVVLPVDSKMNKTEKTNNSTIRVTFPVINNCDDATAELTQSDLVSQNVPVYKNNPINVNVSS